MTVAHGSFPQGALYLASADADYVTGITLPIDGGFTIAQVFPPRPSPPPELAAAPRVLIRIGVHYLQRVPNMHDPIARSDPPVHTNIR